MHRLSPRFCWVVWVMGFVLSACQAEPLPPGPAPTITPEATLPVAHSTLAPTRTPAPTPTPASSIGIEAGELQGTKIRFWYHGSQNVIEEVNLLESQFNATNPWGIWVDAFAYPSSVDLSTAVQKDQAVDHLPDVLLADQIYLSRIGGVEILDLSTFIQDPVWGLVPEQTDDFLEIFWEQQNHSGDQIGIPLLGSARVMFYNQSWAQELGFRPPTSSAEFLAQACAAAQEILSDRSVENNGTGGWLIDSDPLTVSAWIAAYGGEINPASGAGSQFNTPAANEAFAFLKNGFDQGCFWVGRKPDPFGYFAARQALWISANLHEIPLLVNALAADQSQDEWLVLPFPAGGEAPRMLVSTASLQILKASPVEQLASWLFVRWLLEPENQSRLAQASGMVPTQRSTIDRFSDRSSPAPAWLPVIDYLPDAAYLHRDHAWLQVSPIFQDAYRQLFNGTVKPEQIPDLLDQLDETIRDVLENTP